MTPRDTEPLLRQMLHAAGVNDAHPDPLAACEVFKRYVAVPARPPHLELAGEVGAALPRVLRSTSFAAAR